MSWNMKLKGPELNVECRTSLGHQTMTDHFQDLKTFILEPSFLAKQKQVPRTDFGITQGPVYIYDTYIIYWFILRIYLLFLCNCEASKNDASCELHRLQVSVSLDMFQVCPSPTRDERYPKTYYIHDRCWYERHIYSTHDYTSLIHVFLDYCVQYHVVIMCIGNMYIYINICIYH